MEFSTSILSSKLKLSTSTIRKYALLFESIGYEFKRNSDKKRVYCENDLVLLKKFISLKKQYPNSTNKDIAIQILDDYVKIGENDIKEVININNHKVQQELVDEIKTLIVNQNSDISRLESTVTKLLIEHEKISTLQLRLEEKIDLVLNKSILDFIKLKK
ncbi:hypothetical protein MKZ01_14080 [Lysinibacillus endophyticus]|uniref:hypothetical protein n=1 Tax=Ureibacillus endophyticus TaxID=1978490 RepID=UPI00313671B7